MIFVGAGVVLAGCTVPVPLPASVSSTASAVPRDPVSFAGDGELNTAKSSLSGDYSVEWQTMGSCYYSATLKGDDGQYEQVFSASDALTGTGNVYGLEGEYYVDMITGPSGMCAWSVTLTPK